MLTKQQKQILEDLSVLWAKLPDQTFGTLVEHVSVEIAGQAEDRDEEPADELASETDEHIAAALKELIAS